jgi:hypothetical protein
MVGMLSTELENVCTELECFLEGWNAFDRVGSPLYRVGMLSIGLQCILERCNAYNRVGIHFYKVGMLSRRLECFRQSWNNFVQSWNAF